MRINNPWLGYLDRTYLEIKESIINRLRINTPEVTDLNESNLLIIIVGIFAGIGEQFNYYIDERAKESFLATARRFSSVIKLVKLIDYRARAANPASVDLYFTYVDNNGNPVIITEPGVIPQGTEINTSNGMVWLTSESVEVPIGTSYIKVPASQTEAQEDIILGTTTNNQNQEFVIPGDYAEGSMEIKINGETWENVESLAYSFPLSKHYVVQVGEDSIPRVIFGNGVRGKIPPTGQEIVANYFTTQGYEGNNVSRGTINQLASVLVIPDPAVSVMVRNEFPPSGGMDIEDIDSIKFNAPLSTKTVNRAVTPPDFNYLAQKYPGVAKAKTVFDCGVYADVYVYPSGGGLASTSLLQGTKDYLEEIKSLAPQIQVKPAGETPVVIELNVFPRFRVNNVDLTNEILLTLLDTFSIENNEINGRIAISDIIAAVDNMPRVDTVDLLALYTLPYARPINHEDPLVWERETLYGSTQRIVWRLVYDGTNFRFFKGPLLIQLIPLNVVYTDPENIIKVKIDPAGMYTQGQAWQFVTYPYNKNIILDDNSVPVVNSGTIKINIINR